MLHFLFDNQCSQRMATGLNILEEGNDRSLRQSKVSHVKDHIPGNSDDEKVIELAGSLGAVIITYDKGFKTIKQRWALYKQYKVGILYFRSYKDVLRYWDIVESFVGQWEEIKEEVDKTEMPFVIEVTKNGFSNKTHLLD